VLHQDLVYVHVRVVTVWAVPGHAWAVPGHAWAVPGHAWPDCREQVLTILSDAARIVLCKSTYYHAVCYLSCGAILPPGGQLAPFFKSWLKLTVDGALNTGVLL
jgi:hypothetical protein